MKRINWDSVGAVTLIIGLIAGSTIAAVSTYKLNKVEASQATSTPAVVSTQEYGYETFNKDLQKYIQERVELEMKNPANQQKYRDMVTDQVVRNINLLTKTDY